MDEWFNRLNEWALFFGMLAVLSLAAELGFRLARRELSEKGEIFQHASAIQGAVLGLLALLLGFTFSLAMARFEARREIMRDEVNAIGTTYLRSQLLPEPMGPRMRALLRSYVETRFALRDATPSPERVREVNARVGLLHNQMWEQFIAATRTDVQPELLALFGSSLNETIDMHGKRVAAVRAQVPFQVFTLLFVVATVSLGLTGYASGPSHRQSVVLNGMVALLIAMVTMLIFDLHRPTRGYITTDMTGLVELRESLR